MPIEIEAKMRLDHRPDLEAQLQRIGAAPGPVIHEVNTYFDTTNSSLRNADKGLRLRVERNPDGSLRQSVITFKGPRAPGDIKQREEIELPVQDADAARQLLQALGYSTGLTFEKHRTRWSVDACLVDIDTLPLIGTFVEIEGPTEPDVTNVRRTLLLDKYPLISTGYIALLTTYLEQHQITDSYIPLPADP